jgi:hypothetical protein
MCVYTYIKNVGNMWLRSSGLYPKYTNLCTEKTFVISVWELKIW